MIGDLIGDLAGEVKELLDSLGLTDLLKNLFESAVKKLTSVLKTEWDKIKGKIGNSEAEKILEEFAKDLKMGAEKGAQKLETYFQDLEAEYPDLKVDMEKIKESMLESLPKLDALIDNALDKIGQWFLKFQIKLPLQFSWIIFKYKTF